MATVRAKGNSGFLEFKSKQESTRKVLGAAWTKEEYREWLTAVGEAYAIMPDETRQPYINARRDKSRSAREDADTQREIDAQQALINRSRAGVLETVVSECGSKTQPFTTASFLQEVRR